MILQAECATKCPTLEKGTGSPEVPLPTAVEARQERAETIEWIRLPKQSAGSNEPLLRIGGMRDQDCSNGVAY